MKPANAISLKEWAVINRALGEGEQIFLLRKGGIVEKNDSFELTENEFFIFPTYEHQKSEDLQEKYRGWLGKDPSPGRLSFDVYAEADGIFRVDGFEGLKQVLPFTIWSESYLRKRLDYKPEKPLFLFFVKCRRTASPRQAPSNPDYAGCTSWVDLKEPLLTDGMGPVLPGDVYEAKKKRILEILRSYSAVKG